MSSVYLATRRAHVVPGLVREPLHVVGKVAGEIDDRCAEARLRADAALREPRLDELGEHVGGNLLEAHHRPGLVERPPRADHLLHQARLRAGEHVADLPLLLRRGAQRVFDAAAVEGVDRLELVERDDHRPLALGREAARQREDLVGQPVDVARRSSPAGKATEKRPGRCRPARSGSQAASR